jgi:ACS family pantothenate transporter-like MFS transporter
MTWANELIGDRDVRAIAIAIMNTCSSLMYTWSPLVLWPVTGEKQNKHHMDMKLTFV